MRQAAKKTILQTEKVKNVPSVEISLLITDNIGIQELNRDYRAKDVPTDVLSFAMNEGEDILFCEGVPLILGDIVISADKAAEQAEKFGNTLERETVFLFIHGLLHLLGYDHERGIEDEKEMFALQDVIINDIFGEYTVDVDKYYIMTEVD